MTIIEEIQKVKKMQVTIDKMLEKGSMELRSVNYRRGELSGEKVGNKWVLEPLHEDECCSIGIVSIPKVEIGACDTHVHPGAREYLIVIKGSILLNIDGRDLRIVRESECCVVDAGIQHHSKPLTDDTRMVYVCIPRDSTIPSLNMEIKAHVK